MVVEVTYPSDTSRGNEVTMMCKEGATCSLCLAVCTTLDSNLSVYDIKGRTCLVFCIDDAVIH